MSKLDHTSLRPNSSPRTRQRLDLAEPGARAWSRTADANAPGSLAFESGHSNGVGHDIRSYLAAQRRALAGSEDRFLLASADTRRTPAKAPRTVFGATKTELARLPSNARPSELRAAMDQVIDSLLDDGTWLPPLTPGQEEYVTHGFFRPTELFDDPLTLQVGSAEEVRDWEECGGLDAFRRSMSDFARAIGTRFPPGHPNRGEALSAGYEAFAQRFFVHLGQNLPYDELGTRRDDVPDWADLVSVPYSPVSRNEADIRSGIDCDGFTMVAIEFFEAAGMKTFFNTSMAFDAYHKQGIAVDGDAVVGFSNDRAIALPKPGDGEMGLRFQEWVRGQVNRPDLRLNAEVFESKAVMMQLEAREEMRR